MLAVGRHSSLRLLLRAAHTPVSATIRPEAIAEVNASKSRSVWSAYASANTPSARRTRRRRRGTRRSSPAHPTSHDHGRGPSRTARPRRQVVDGHRLHDRAALHVLELTDVPVAPAPPDCGPEEDVAGRLKPTLPGHDPCAPWRLVTGAQEPFVDRGDGLFDLHEQRDGRRTRHRAARRRAPSPTLPTPTIFIA